MTGDVMETIEEAKTDIKEKDQHPHEAAREFWQDAKEKVHKQQQKLSSANEDEVVEQITEKLTDFVNHVRKHESYQKVLEKFFKYSEEFWDTLYEAKEKVTSQTPELVLNQKISNEAWEILGDFAGIDLVFKFRRNLWTYFDKLKNDQELREWFNEAKQLLLDLIRKPEVNRDEEVNRLVRKGRKISEKHRNDLYRLWKQSQRIIDEIKNDPILLDFGKKLQILGERIFLNSKGQPDLYVMEESIIQIKNLLVPVFNDLFIDVPIKKLQILDKDMACKFEDISIKGTGMIPSHVQVVVGSYSDFYLQKTSDVSQRFLLKFVVEGIRPEFRDVKFDYKKHTFPYIKNNGIADLEFGESGISTYAIFSIDTGNDKITKARLMNFNVTVDTVTINIKEASKHEWLEKMMIAPIYASAFRTRLQNSLHGFILNRLTQYIIELNLWFKTKPLDRAYAQGNVVLRQGTQTLKETYKDIGEKIEGVKDDWSSKTAQLKEDLKSKDQKETEKPVLKPTTLEKT
jgi:hypothetical protein